MLPKDKIESIREQVDRIGSQVRIQSRELQERIRQSLFDPEQRDDNRIRQLIFSTLEQLEKIEVSLVDRADRILAEVEPSLPQQLPFIGITGQAIIRRTRSFIGTIDDRFQQLISQSAVAAGLVPIENYDNLTAKEVIVAISGLSAEEKKAVRQYEANHKNRTSVLRKLDEALNS